MPSFCIRLLNELGRRFSFSAAPPAPSIRPPVDCSTRSMCLRSISSSEPSAGGVASDTGTLAATGESEVADALAIPPAGVEVGETAVVTNIHTDSNPVDFIDRKRAVAEIGELVDA